MRQWRWTLLGLSLLALVYVVGAELVVRSEVDQLSWGRGERGGGAVSRGVGWWW